MKQKKLLAALTAGCLVCSTLPLAAFAQPDGGLNDLNTGARETQTIAENGQSPALTPGYTQNASLSSENAAVSTAPADGGATEHNVAVSVTSADGKTTEYNTDLLSAISTADDGDVIKLLKDVTIDAESELKSVKTDGKFTLDLAGYSITSDQDETVVEIQSGGDVTVKDSAEDNGTVRTKGYFATVEGDGKLTVEDGDFVNNNAALEPGAFSVFHVYELSATPAPTASPESTATPEVTSTPTASADAAASPTINPEYASIFGEYAQTAEESPTPETTATPEVTASPVPTASAAAAPTATAAPGIDVKSGLLINGGSFTSAKSPITYSGKVQIGINDGAFITGVGYAPISSADQSAIGADIILPEGKALSAIENDENDTVTYAVTQAQDIASVGEEKYTTLGEAFAAAEDGSTIKLVSDATAAQDAVVPEGKTLILDLSGYDYNNVSGAAITVSNGGGISIIDGGETKGSLSGLSGAVCAVSAADSTITIDGAVLMSGSGAAVNADAGSSNVAINITGGAYVAGINDQAASSMINIQADENTAPIIAASAQGDALYTENGSVNINGGELTAQRAIYLGTGASAEITDGSISGTIYMTGATLNISGGEFVSDGYVIDMTSGCALDISGGSFRNASAGAYPVINMFDAAMQSEVVNTIDISGGTFEIVNNHIIIAAASAEINISDGIFTSSYSNTGTPEEASAACDSIIYACDNYTSALNITGGTFTTSDGGSVITPGTLGSMTVALDGGIFNSNLVAGENAATEPNTIAVGNTALTANAAVIAADKLPANFTATDITLGGAAYKMVGEAEVGVGRIGSEFYTDAEAFDEAIKNIDENDTVINIFEDVTLGGEINIPTETTVTIKDGKTVKLLGGAALTNNGSINGSVGVQDGAAMINNGNINGTVYVEGGADSEEPGALTNAAAGRIEGRIIITGTGVFENLNTEEGSAPEPEYVVSAIAFTSDSTTVVLGRTRQLEVVFIPENAEAPITWSSSDENVARVDENGVVSGLSLGTATITAICGEGENAMTATCEVTVRQQGGVTGNLGWGEGTNTEYTVYIGNTQNGTVTASQSRAGRGDTVTFRTSPDDGYTVYTVNVYDAYGDDVSVLKNSENSYEFTMPGSSVTIRVEFTEDDVWRNPYRDVSESDWFYDAVEYVAKNGLFYGTETYLFSPNDTMTRAMLVTVIYRMEGMPAVSSGSTFSDVVTTEYYADAVKWASANGIVNGIGYNLFAPNDNVTREQIAAIIHRYSQYKGYATSASGNLGRFTDANAISSWALSDLRWAVGTGLMIGHDDGRLGPADNATRAEVATMLMRYCEDIAN